MSRLILGINTDHADSSAALVGEDGIIAAIAEERINRKKHCADFPALAIAEVLRIAGASVGDLTDIAVARDPQASLTKKAAFVARYPTKAGKQAFRRLAIHRRAASVQERMSEEMGIAQGSLRATTHNVEHHLAHVASAYYWSPFDRCVAFTNDGVGDFASTMWARCEGNDISVIERTHWPHSLGVFYTAVCQFIGFDGYGEEYKVMGLSAYGRNRHSRLMRDMVRYDADHGLRLNLDYYRHHLKEGAFETIKDGLVKLEMLYSDKLARELGPPRERSEPIGEREQDLAASMQTRYEEVFLDMVFELARRTGMRRLVSAGGCALNSVANGRMLTEGYIDEAYFQPAASDDGTALGAALHVAHGKHNMRRTGEVRHSLWGTEWADADIEAALKANGRKYKRLETRPLMDQAVEALSKGHIIGWFQGREEWGPRALGNRSILCNPSWPEMKAILNSRIKNREPFRPFAPVCRLEDLDRCFEGDHPVPFMIVVYKVRPEWRERLDATTHDDGTGRVQTVREDENPMLHELLGVFCDKTGIPALLNTSFNENEPIVHTPAQAIDCFERTRMDGLAIGPFWMEKKGTRG